jgi:hypothetical protein
LLADSLHAFLRPSLLPGPFHLDPSSGRFRWSALAVTSLGALLSALTSGTLGRRSGAGDRSGTVHRGLHVAFAAGVVASAIGAGASLLRGGQQSWEPATTERVRLGSAGRHRAAGD